MTRPDNRLDALPMSPLTCKRCQAVVQVRKASWHQTSIQWDDAAVGTCAERRAAHIHGRVCEADFPTCSALRESISDAAVSGELHVVQV